jgi:EPS-associated MarR family transcriptional regulator
MRPRLAGPNRNRYPEFAAMSSDQRTFKILDELHRTEVISQRELAGRTGISLGQVNYLLNRLMEKGLIKFRNFKHSTNKKKYAYILTPRGIETKSRLAVRFILDRLKEYNRLKKAMARRLDMVLDKKSSRIVFVGPQRAEEFLLAIVRENGHDIDIVHRCEHWRDLVGIDQPCDKVLLLDDASEDVIEIESVTGIERNRLIFLG